MSPPSQTINDKRIRKRRNDMAGNHYEGRREGKPAKLRTEN
jgi:hypothetical protein